MCVTRTSRPSVRLQDHGHSELACPKYVTRTCDGQHQKSTLSQRGTTTVNRPLTCSVFIASLNFDLKWLVWIVCYDFFNLNFNVCFFRQSRTSIDEIWLFRNVEEENVPFTQTADHLARRWRSGARMVPIRKSHTKLTIMENQREWRSGWLSDHMIYKSLGLF